MFSGGRDRKILGKSQGHLIDEEILGVGPGVLKESSDRKMLSHTQRSEPLKVYFAGMWTVFGNGTVQVYRTPSVFNPYANGLETPLSSLTTCLMQEIRSYVGDDFLTLPRVVHTRGSIDEHWSVYSPVFRFNNCGLVQTGFCTTKGFTMISERPLIHCFDTDEEIEETCLGIDLVPPKKNKRSRKKSVKGYKSDPWKLRKRGTIENIQRYRLPSDFDGKGRLKDMVSRRRILEEQLAHKFQVIQNSQFDEVSSLEATRRRRAMFEDIVAAAAGEEVTPAHTAEAHFRIWYEGIHGLPVVDNDERRKLYRKSLMSVLYNIKNGKDQGEPPVVKELVLAHWEEGLKESTVLEAKKRIKKAPEDQDGKPHAEPKPPKDVLPPREGLEGKRIKCGNSYMSLYEESNKDDTVRTPPPRPRFHRCRTLAQVDLREVVIQQ